MFFALFEKLFSVECIEYSELSFCSVQQYQSTKRKPKSTSGNKGKENKGTKKHQNETVSSLMSIYETLRKAVAFNPLSVNPRKWSNTVKQIVDCC